MARENRDQLTREDVEALLDRLKVDVPRQECWCCECLQGFLAQLRLDAVPEAKPLLASYRLTTVEVHPSLSCEPCPPADRFAEYLIRRREP